MFGSMFKRAVAAHAAKSEATGPAVREGIEQIVCTHCGAPRQNEERICRYCKQAV